MTLTLDNPTLKALKKIVKLSGVSRDDVVNVILAMEVIKRTGK
jgi:hypothetical protein